MTDSQASPSTVDETRWIDEFDGFSHTSRPYDPKIDGWRTEQLKASGSMAVRVAREVLSLFDLVNQLKRQNWELKQEVIQWKTAAGFPPKGQTEVKHE